MHPEMVDMKYDWYSGVGYIGGSYIYKPKSDVIIDGERNDLWKEYFNRKMEEIETFQNTNVLIEDYSLITYYDGTDASDRVYRFSIDMDKQSVTEEMNENGELVCVAETFGATPKNCCIQRKNMNVKTLKLILIRLRFIHLNLQKIGRRRGKLRIGYKKESNRTKQVFCSLFLLE